jgi:hypothetical protein
MFTLGLR